MPEGFITHPSYRLEKERPVLLFHGRLDSGRRFLIREDRFRPYCFIRASQAGQAVLRRGRLEEAPGLTTLAGEPVLRVVFERPAELRDARTKIGASGIDLYEADLRFPIRFLIDRGL